MSNLFNRKPARQLKHNVVSPKLAPTPHQGQASELIGYDQKLGLLGQSTSFYVGISLGVVFQAALVTISLSLS